ncbi:Gfo/Idh/MocA family protein [Haematomicrobium sanguinis]|uniref:Gfo/Idh/MocA family protein n=1 Tax=Haematomicrobium sanguinis TaxID=479106 RepID=UPI000479A1C6|nr:Gfo/Idh/MocA family oxidoreductase [Haematomicrobium sanguinis]
MPATPLRLAVIGGGARGTQYAKIAAATGRSAIVSIADPREEVRTRFQQTYGIADEHTFATWREFATAQPAADAVIIATPDALHTEPAVALADAGYNILLEKPMAPREADARRIVEAVERNRSIFMVAHVLRYSLYTRTLKDLLDAGTIGTLVSIEHVEPIGWWHFAHSYVRGNWAREATSSPMLLAKSSHDLDWITFISGREARKVSSFGSLFYFRPENKPAGAANRCLDCVLVNTCAYSAPTIYRRFLGDPVGEVWPLGVLTPHVSEASVMDALANGPYGECVFNGQNDVADHQITNIEFDDGSTASFTAVAFSELDFRKTRIFGTAGRIEGDGTRLKILDFATNTERTIDLATRGGASAADGHGGADDELILAFLNALQNPTEADAANASTSFRSHALVWAAEESRHTGQTVSMAELAAAAHR